MMCSIQKGLSNSSDYLRLKTLVARSQLTIKQTREKSTLITLAIYLTDCSEHETDPVWFDSDCSEHETDPVWFVSHQTLCHQTLAI